MFLKTVSSIYDPLGLLSPAVVSLKMLFQEVCTHKIAWGTPLPDRLYHESTGLVLLQKRLKMGSKVAKET